MNAAEILTAARTLKAAIEARADATTGAENRAWDEALSCAEGVLDAAGAAVRAAEHFHSLLYTAHDALRAVDASDTTKPQTAETLDLISEAIEAIESAAWRDGFALGAAYTSPGEAIALLTGQEIDALFRVAAE